MEEPRRVDDVRARLRASGLRTTAPRLAVMMRLEDETGPVSHGELFELLSAQGFDRATVYRNLIDLTEAGLVTRADLGDHVWRFEPRRDRVNDGARFVCGECGTISVMRDVKIDVKNAARHGQVREILFKGTCARCAS